ncbi:hypothetical protein KY290_027595 [Solanum tuberosum]|uniref:Integrase core domain containing protein n=1 Tax=Solanum tuberosum TaxID=4113 RepID=A0ABQ7UGS3_SOLTU|nr:hypothetical protein KY290_027595 [Solanum tuberosum]
MSYQARDVHLLDQHHISTFYNLKNTIDKLTHACPRDNNHCPSIVGELSKHETIKSLEGFLADWWDSFYSMFSSIQAKYAQDPYAKAARTMDNVVCQVPFVVPSSSPQREPFVTDISHQIELIRNMSQQREAIDETEDIEQTMNMEPIVNTPEKAASGSRSFLKGSSTSVMQQAP